MFYSVNRGSYRVYSCFVISVIIFFLFQSTIKIYFDSTTMAINIFAVMIAAFDLWNLTIANGLDLKNQVNAMILLIAKLGAMFTNSIAIMILFPIFTFNFCYLYFASERHRVNYQICHYVEND